MQDVFEKYKTAIIVGVVALVLIVGGVIYSSSRTQQVEVAESVTEEEELDEPIPTVDASVKVTLEGANGGREVELTVDGAPAGTEDIEAELSYETSDKGLQGAIATLMPEDGKASKTITLGTCSSGTCVYHDITSDIKVTLKFSGEYGERIFEKSYKI